MVTSLPDHGPRAMAVVPFYPPVRNLLEYLVFSRTLLHVHIRGFFRIRTYIHIEITFETEKRVARRPPMRTKISKITMAFLPEMFAL